jgi:hypothetical protein
MICPPPQLLEQQLVRALDVNAQYSSFVSDVRDRSVGSFDLAAAADAEGTAVQNAMDDLDLATLRPRARTAAPAAPWRPDAEEEAASAPARKGAPARCPCFSRGAERVIRACSVRATRRG